MWFRNCIVNGGGYSIYAAGKSKDFSFDNVGFDGISFGAAEMYGIAYPSAEWDVKMSNLQLTDSLYIGSVWKDEEGTHFSVTNDTTLEGFGTQIRFVNWSNEKVYLSKETVDRVYAVNEEEVLLSGKCGNNITLTLTHEGVLALAGMGAIYNYHSAKSPEWSEYMDYIKEIRVEEGIEGLGSMIFRKCGSVQRVSLPDTLTTIGQYAFGGCVGLQEVTLPPNILRFKIYITCRKTSGQS
ncbi:MAG: leucine-rich repeat protein [Lachnospiraceae bacterium]|nr:leucine-rich repeat protein [Lachnospiraceae bacterium]